MSYRKTERSSKAIGPNQRAKIPITRALDVLIASALLIIVFPLICTIAVIIKWETRGPVFEKRLCIGRAGRRFHILMFRTTEVDAERPSWAEKTTRLGQLLRYTRIESLPQLINVLRGDMSLVDTDARHPSFLS